MATRQEKAAKEIKSRVQDLADASTELTHTAYDKAEVALKQVERVVKDNRWPVAAIGVVVGAIVIVALAARLVLGVRQTREQMPRAYSEDRG
jgi:ElaB/YqjD/DUF883 family membrane-anchored ribosome-binding protein